MYYIYILYSKEKDRYYIGQTNNIKKRLLRHNKGEVRSTKYGIPWDLKYYEEYGTRSLAMKREKYLKSMKSRKAIELLVKAMD